jgi:hypothetical protein
METPCSGRAVEKLTSLLLKNAAEKTICHPEQSEGPLHFVGSTSLQASYIGPSLRSG